MNDSDTITLRDGTIVPTPRLRNGLVDGDKLRSLLNYTGPTALESRADERQRKAVGTIVHPMFR